MLKKTITYENYNGEKITEDFYFNLSKAELIELQLSEKEGLEVALQKIIDSEDGKMIMDKFKELILMTYGIKTPDGKRFIKSQEIIDAFVQSDAYSELFMQLVTDAGFAAEFVNGVVPASLIAELKKAESTVAPREIIAELPEPSAKDLREMSKEELLEAFKNRNTQ